MRKSVICLNRLEPLKYNVLSKKNRAQQAQEQNRARGSPTGTTCLIGTVRLLVPIVKCSPAPTRAPSGAKTSDGCIIYHFFPNIKFPAPNSPPTSPTVSAPPDYCFWHCLHIFTNAPNLYSTAPSHYTPPPSYPAPSASQPPYPLIQNTLLLILTSSGTMAQSFFLGGGEYPVWIDEVIQASPGYSCIRVVTTGAPSVDKLSMFSHSTKAKSTTHLQIM
jgi:hypothetical protein